MSWYPQIIEQEEGVLIMSQALPSSYYTPETLSQLYQLPKTTIWKMIRDGKFKNVIKVGKHYRIPTQSREEFERKHQIA